MHIHRFLLFDRPKPPKNVEIVDYDMKKGSAILEKQLYSDENEGWLKKFRNFISFPKLFWPTVRKNCSCDQEKPSKFKAESQEFGFFLSS